MYDHQALVNPDALTVAVRATGDVDLEGRGRGVETTAGEVRLETDARVDRRLWADLTGR